MLRPERRPDVKVLLLIDVGGSMDPHVQVSERLFSAAKRATHWKRLDTFYFHNCLYGHVYPTTWLRDGIAIPQLLAERDPTWKLIVVGDALMHPSELWQTGGWGGQDFDNDVPGLAWMDMVARHFRKTAWLNPEPESLLARHRADARQPVPHVPPLARRARAGRRAPHAWQATLMRLALIFVAAMTLVTDNMKYPDTKRDDDRRRRPRRQDPRSLSLARGRDQARRQGVDGAPRTSRRATVSRSCPGATS